MQTERNMGVKATAATRKWAAAITAGQEKQSGKMSLSLSYVWGAAAEYRLAAE
jgi:hypothetical protein